MVGPSRYTNCRKAYWNLMEAAACMVNLYQEP